MLKFFEHNLVRFGSIILIGVITSVVGFIITKLATDSVEIRIIATTLSGGLGLLLSHMFSLFGKFESLESSISNRISSLEHSILNSISSSISTGVRIEEFRPGDAYNYIINNAIKCKHIYNTRFAQAVPSERGALLRYRREMDNAIFYAIKNGCYYTIIYDSDRHDTVQHIFDRLNELEQEPRIGLFSAHAISVRELPLLQMTLLDFSDGSQHALVGWSTKNSFWQTDATVYLFSGGNKVKNGSFELFRSVFAAYQGAAKPEVL